MCTVVKHGDIFVLTLTGADDQHRLNPTVVADIRSSLAEIKSSATSASALITTATGKFFSNGFDLRWAQSSSSVSYMMETLKDIISDLLSLPMPTIAAVSGHAAGSGFAFALCHDYFLMQRDRGVLYMSELDIGMTFPKYFSVFFKEKLGSMAGRRQVMLRAAKIKGEEAVRIGMVDSVHDGADEVVAAAMRLAEELVARKWNGEVYAEIRKALYPDSCKEFGLTSKLMFVAKL